MEEMASSVDAAGSFGWDRSVLMGSSSQGFIGATDQPLWSGSSGTINVLTSSGTGGVYLSASDVK